MERKAVRVVLREGVELFAAEDVLHLFCSLHQQRREDDLALLLLTMKSLVVESSASCRTPRKTWRIGVMPGVVRRGAAEARTDQSPLR